MNRPAIFCSVIIPTVGRATLERAVESVLSQEVKQDTFEVVVVNDSGKALTPQEWQQSPYVRMIGTQRRKQVTARNTGAAVACGRYLLFLDDDDWLVPGALHYYRNLAEQHPAVGCLFGGFEQVDDQGRVIARRGLPTSGNVAIQLVSGIWMQVAAVLVRADVFYAAGGLSPLFKISEEIDLFNRIAMREDFAGSDTVVAQIHRGPSWQTSVDYSDVYEFNRLARDRALSSPDAFDRLHHSAGDSSYWNGRLVRLYFVSMLWNWRRKRRFFTGVSRGMFTLRSVLVGWMHLLSRDFWRGLRQHSPETR